MTDELTLENERRLLRTLQERVKLRAASESQIESQYSAETAAENLQYQAVFQHLTESYEAAHVNIEQNRQQLLADNDHRCQSESGVVQSEYQRILGEAEDRFTAETEAATKERDESVWLVSSLLDDDTEGSPLQRFQLAQTTFAAAGIELTAGMESLESGYQQVIQFLRKCRLWSETTKPDPTVELSTVDAMKSACLAAISAAEPIRRTVLGRMLPLLFVGVVPVLVFLVMTGIVFGVIWGFIDPAWLQLKPRPSDRDWALISLGIAAAFSIVPLFFLHHSASRATWPDFEQLLQLRVDARFSHSVWEKTSKTELNMLEAECSHLQELRVKRRESAIAAAESKMEARHSEAERLRGLALEHAYSAYPARLNSLESRRSNEHDKIERKYTNDAEELLFRRENDFRSLQAEHDNRTSDSRRRYQQSWLELIRAWQADIAYLSEQSDNLCSLATSICPPWQTVLQEDAPFPSNSPAVLGLGQIQVDLEAIEGGLSANPKLKVNRPRFDLPILLPLRDHPSLILKASGAGRDAAVKVLQTSMLRFLTSLPPGKVRFTILDPVGLGANFSAFMHLADYDELLVTSRIWTEPSHIEKRLADLTEHMETVLQTYLRNEFPTIDDYNEFAGEVAEPYRVLVVANFPANFSEVALRRIASIADGGSRCGVYLLMSFDTSQEIPRSFTRTDLDKHATVLEWTNDGFRSADSELSSWPLTLDLPPPADEFGQIVRVAGQHSRDVRRVEVPFERVVPNEDQFWTSDSRTGIDVPIGRAGATKLQSLRLGKGTSQHVLVAGKTGSGKSTLLHALITNLSLYYSPSEVQFYLIDFKKGVEFKVYAEQQLPHARVIAIESDREFGVSVLERLDSLLRDRGELFREAGVQDIAGYRNARPNAVMPRTLLLVDEFQEFFIEDDAMSQQASLLLDRLIRQGRAFGVHILLGSQTLAGAYSLARSTLGQVAVRIALQCSETDAHLILSEENTAARLLTRPGEAIYNDANGLIEGNHPFQIVWLGDEEREGYLSLLREEAEGIGSHQKSTDAIREIASSPPLVFEGNIPADPTTNRELLRTLAKCRAAWLAVPQPAFDSPWSCWLGDSVSMAGPVELRFGLREGGNTLIVGRDAQAALGVMSACALTLSAQAICSGMTSSVIQVLDGSLPNSETGQTWRLLESIWARPKNSSSNETALNETVSNGSASHDSTEQSDTGLSTNTANDRLIQVSTTRQTASVLNNVVAELQRRADEPGPPMFLFVFDLSRFRDLRKAEDDYGYSGLGGGEKTANPAQIFSEILRDGPGVGIFTFAWVDSYQSAQRWLSRDQMNRFEQRVLFAMNVNDSSSLIDSPLAGRLGENRALLYRGESGTIEKLRPFSPPPPSWLRQLAATIDSPSPASVAPTETASSQPHAATSEPSEPIPAPVSIESPSPADVGVSDELPSIDDMHVL